MKNYLRGAGIGVLMLFLLAGCGAPAAATEVAFADVCDPALDHERISTVGYFAAGVTVFCSDIGDSGYRCGMDFVETPGSADTFTADVLEGNRPNQMLPVPEDYTDADIQFKTDDGTVIGVDQKVRISGEMLIGEGVCLMTVDRIDAVTE